ncbi:ComEA family DNA-binding protein [Parafrankia elaeagni]|uniref:ComEA family DNA-binding protein n=1 Tax=Parafrankia elaeagni TaxID=222534 RepID=UPI000380E233|nr:ComEA family DNA-binding protein [Parafrankia elaeagni]
MDRRLPRSDQQLPQASDPTTEPLARSWAQPPPHERPGGPRIRYGEFGDVGPATGPGPATGAGAGAGAGGRPEGWAGAGAYGGDVGGGADEPDQIDDWLDEFAGDTGRMHPDPADGPTGSSRGPRRPRWRVADRLPPTLRDAVLAPTARAALVLVLVAVLAAAAAGWMAWRNRPVSLGPPVPVRSGAEGVPGTESVSPLGAAPGTRATGPPEAAGAGGAAAPAVPGAGSERAEATAGSEVVVDVAGRVVRPGVVRLPAGARVVDALTRAGGPLPGTDTSGIALARILTDGEQILVDGRPGPAPPPPGAVADPGLGAAASGGTAGAGGQPLDLNTATVAQLDDLPGVGPVLAQRIIDWRSENGPFTSPDQLGEVTGVGDRRLADLLPLVRV